MFRIYNLLLFTYFFFHLHASGNIAKYINMKYAYLSYSAIFIFALLTIVQVYDYFKGGGEAAGELCCDHDHSDEKDKPFYQRWFFYGVFAFPLAAGLFFPIATLDSTIVKSKGFSFKPIEQIEAADHYAQTQYLKPDTSVYYGKEGYDELMEKELSKYISKEHIALRDDQFLKGMETIYHFPGDFLGKVIEFDGFAFRGESPDQRQLFVLRFGVIHCVADSGAFGMLAEFPEETKLQDDDWIHVKGTLSSMYYQPFKATIPVLRVKEWHAIDKPKEPYVYRGY